MKVKIKAKPKPDPFRKDAPAHTVDLYSCQKCFHTCTLDDYDCLGADEDKLFCNQCGHHGWPVRTGWIRESFSRRSLPMPDDLAAAIQRCRRIIACVERSESASGEEQTMQSLMTLLTLAECQAAEIAYYRSHFGTLLELSDFTDSARAEFVRVVGGDQP